MRDELLDYYERELAYVRRLGAEFAHKYPKVASRLLLEPDKCEDPHVERLLEAFAFLAGRVHLKMDDEFPQITESFLNVLYPHYLAPIPSMSIAQFNLDPRQGKLTTGYQVERGTPLYSRPIQGAPCRFRTTYPLTLWPIEVTSASLESPDPPNSHGRWGRAVLRISLKCTNGTRLAELKRDIKYGGGTLDKLRFYLHGEPQLVMPLYEIIFNHATGLTIEPVVTGPAKWMTGKFAAPIELDASGLSQVGFEEHEGMLPYSARSFLGFRLLTEYFAFPYKFLFVDIGGIDAAVRAGFGDEFTIAIHLRDIIPPSLPVEASTFQLGCVPIVNLFQKPAEPIRLSHERYEYRVVPDVHRQATTEVYTIDSVTSVDPARQVSREFQPFYSLKHAKDRDHNRTYWYANRQASQREHDAGTETYLSFVDLGFEPSSPATETLTVQVTCTNRDLPARLPFGGKDSDFEVEGTIPLASVRCLKKPTDPLRPALRRGAQWRLISHLALNPYSLVDAAGGEPHALREMLMLYDFADSPATRKQIAAISSISNRRVVRQVGPRVGTGYLRGVETTIGFDEKGFVGGSMFLLASVLERFLALYVSVNSFNELLVTTEQREGYVRRWRPRAGEQILL